MRDIYSNFNPNPPKKFLTINSSTLFKYGIPVYIFVMISKTILLSPQIIRDCWKGAFHNDLSTKVPKYWPPN